MDVLNDPLKAHCTRFNFYPVIQNLRKRFKVLNENKNEIFITIPSIPFLGTNFQKLKKQSNFFNQITNSLFIDDNHVTKHPRFHALTQHIRQRRTKKVDIRVPIYQDKFTNLQQHSEYQPYPGFIYMDAMAFGMGMACLQTTFSIKDVNHARYTDDQLHVFSPLFLALTAGTPILKGKLSKWDARWKIIESSVDDRTQEQFHEKNAKYQPKSRFSSASYFISNHKNNKQVYNDQRIQTNYQVMKFIKQCQSQFGVEIDQLLLYHLGIILSRDFLVAYQSFLKMDQKEHMLFEMINSINWNSVRFKIPIHDIGWRVEFRSMEIQLTGDQNASYSLVVYFLILILNNLPDINFYIPITKINQNFDRAHQQNAILKQKFYFRINIFEDSEPIIQELTLNEIFFGSQTFQFWTFYIPSNIKRKTRNKLEEPFQYFNQFKSLLNRKLRVRLTLAQWIRKFVFNHPEYKFDSIVSQQISNDLVKRLVDISKGKILDDTFSRIFQF